MHLVQHELRQVFHPSTKVKSQLSFLPRNAQSSLQLILHMPGRAVPGGWLPGSKAALHVVRGANLPCKPGLVLLLTLLQLDCTSSFSRDHSLRALFSGLQIKPMMHEEH